MSFYHYLIETHQSGTDGHAIRGNGFQVSCWPTPAPARYDMRTAPEAGPACGELRTPIEPHGRRGGAAEGGCPMQYTFVSADDHLDLNYTPADLWQQRLPVRY